MQREEQRLSSLPHCGSCTYRYIKCCFFLILQCIILVTNFVKWCGQQIFMKISTEKNSNFVKQCGQQIFMKISTEKIQIL
jgi:hypothetical protein